MFNRRTISPMLFTIQIPIFGTGIMLNSRKADPMKSAEQIPTFGAVVVDFANWLLVTHRSE